ncbi:LysR family transcriptional regulator [Pelistega sp. NLN82]|uniref:LysR family transcriptional regulator n=1 Tax=Pelistega ratti TaxID=2652177 RepID=A0A6L9Y4Z7_9BURK|nr:LysR family transcriptional regulator [Pelistega ratti]NEN75047.1 LysR family transcriptional regulator [Pelistega ratti]
MNKLNALHYFCIASETLNFREAAIQLSISPSVITRVITELEQTLGEQLFKRNTRHIQLTSFGEQFLIKAKQIIADTDSLFQSGKHKNNEMTGIVRITLPHWQHNNVILAELLEAVQPYPQLIIDWREDMEKLDTVKHRIDIGLRIGKVPRSHFIIRHIAEVQDWIVASPHLIERLGKPKNLDDLQQNFPFSIPINVETGRAWELQLNKTQKLVPRKINFYSTNPESELKAALQGHSVAFISELLCKPYLDSGELVKILPKIKIDKWQLYLYRPYQTITSPHVLFIFDQLTDILKKYYGNI